MSNGFNCIFKKEVILPHPVFAFLMFKVDIGSPIFCEVKKPRFGKTNRKEPLTVSQFGLAGVITSKNTELVNLLKFNSTISVMKADNITHFAHFIFSVLKHIV